MVVEEKEFVYCKNCGKEIDENAVVCVHCGAQLKELKTETIASANTMQDDTGSIGWGILGFFFPIVGLVLYLIWKETRPKTAKVAGKGALISVIIEFVLGFLLGLLVGLGIIPESIVDFI